MNYVIPLAALGVGYYLYTKSLDTIRTMPMDMMDSIVSSVERITSGSPPIAPVPGNSLSGLFGFQNFNTPGRPGVMPWDGLLPGTTVSVDESIMTFPWPPVYVDEEAPHGY